MSTTKYPLNIDQDPHVRIITRRYSLPGADHSTAYVEKQNIVLANSYFYIPHLALGSSTAWGEEHVSYTITETAQAIKQQEGAFSAALTGIKGLGVDAIKSIDSLAVGALGNAQKTGAALSGRLLRPNEVLVLDSVGRFSINLSFELKAQNAKEGDEIQRILKNFRKWSQPTLKTNEGASNMVLEYPPIFDIVFNPKSAGLNTVSWKDLDQGLFTYRNMVMESFNVSIAGGANEALFYYDGTPITAIMDLTFKSIRPGWNNPEDKGTN